MAQIGKQISLRREVPGHVIIVEVKNLEVPKAVKLWGEAEVKHIVGKIEVAEVGYVGNLRRNRTRDEVGGNGEIDKEPELSHVWRERTGETEVGDVK